MLLLLLLQEQDHYKPIASTMRFNLQAALLGLAAAISSNSNPVVFATEEGGEVVEACDNIGKLSSSTKKFNLNETSDNVIYIGY